MQHRQWPVCTHQRSNLGTYALGASDFGIILPVVATGTGAYYGIVTSTAKGPVAPEPFTAFGPITGTAWTGNTLTAGTLTPSDATVTYQWQNASAENGPTPISGAPRALRSE